MSRLIDFINKNAGSDSFLKGLNIADNDSEECLSNLFGSSINFTKLQKVDMPAYSAQNTFGLYKITLQANNLPAPFTFIDIKNSDLCIDFGVFNNQKSLNGQILGISGTIKIHDFLFYFKYDKGHFSAKIKEANPPTLNSLLNCILPSKIDIPIADDIAVSEVDFFIDFNAHPISFGFSIKSKGKIDIFNHTGSVVIEDPSISIVFIGSKPSSVRFDSLWDIDKSYIFKLDLEHDFGMGTDFSLHYSENYSQAQLQGSNVTAKLQLSHLTKSIPYLDSGNLGDVLKEFNNIDITEIMLHGNLGSKVVGAKVYGSWTPQDDKIQKVLSGKEDVYGEFSHDAVNKITSYTLGATFEETNADKTITTIGVSLSHTGEDGANQYSIFGKEMNVNIGDLITKAETHLHKMFPEETVALPPEIIKALSAITVDSFDLTKQDDIRFSLKIKTGLNLGRFLKDIGIDINIGDFNPTINEFEFDYVNSADKHKSYSLSAWLSNNPTDKKPAYLLKITKISSGEGTDSLSVGNIYNLGGGTINIPDMGGLDINDFFFAHFKINEKTTVNLLGSDIDLNAEVDLSKMKVVGHFFSNAGVKLDAFRVVYNNGAIDAESLTVLNQVLQGSKISPLTNPRSSATNTSGGLLGLDKGLTVQGNIIIDKTHIIPLHSTADSTGTKNADGTTSVTIQDSAATPTPVGKKFGPVTFTSVSVGVKTGKIHVIINGNLHIGPLEVDLINFTIDTPIPSKSSPFPLPSFDINGLALKIVKPPLILEGEFLKENRYYHLDKTIDNSSTLKPKEASPYPVPFTQYSGGLSIGIKKIQIVALGSYAKIDDPVDITSLFIYGALAVPIGLPPIALLESVALGFGMNRNVVLPAPINIDRHPLVAPLLGTLPDFTTMNNTIIIEKGENWFALGVRLLVLEMMDAMVLLVVKFGNKLEIDILGRAAFTLPKTAQGEPALCNLIIGIVAEIIPDEGIVSVLGGFLKGSYIYCPDVQISGGFGLLHITEGDRTGTPYVNAQEGEFVLTIGGYSPYYKPKPYYPSVPRLAMAWRVSDNLNITAQAYCAIVPEAFMVGGQLSADFNEGGDFAISVHFEVGADFILWFKPYHYRGDAYMSLAITATLNIHLWFIHIHQSIEIDAHADVLFWGPDFAGHADVSVHFIVTFSASVNFGPPLKPPPPLSLTEFLNSFFKVDKDANGNAIKDSKGNPTYNSNLSIQITDGLLSHQPFVIDPKTNKKVRPTYTDTNKPITIVNSKEIELNLTSSFPIKTLQINKGTLSNGATDLTSMGIAPMANANNDFSKSEFSVTISKNGNLVDTSEINNLLIEPLYHNFPAGMWKAVDTGGKLQDPDHNKSLLNLCSGLKIRTKAASTKGSGISIPQTQFDTISMPSFSLNDDTFTYN